ncbi:hypothetical protein YC2023_057084 [Brassica napus]
MKFIVYTIALLLVLLTQGRSDDEHWCIASPGTPDWLLQSNLDYACGCNDPPPLSPLSPPSPPSPNSLKRKRERGKEREREKER